MSSVCVLYTSVGSSFKLIYFFFESSNENIVSLVITWKLQQMLSILDIESAVKFKIKLPFLSGWDFVDQKLSLIATGLLSPNLLEIKLQR